MTDNLFWQGLNLVRSEVNPEVRARLLTIYAVESLRGELREELLSEAYDAVKEIAPELRGGTLQQITFMLLQARLFQE